MVCPPAGPEGVSFPLVPSMTPPLGFPAYIISSMKPPRERRAELLEAAVRMLGDGTAAAIPVREGDVSMQPTLAAGQLLWVEFEPAQLRTGDVLLFRQQDYLVVHRLLGRARTPAGRPSLRTRGDGWNGLDPHLEPDRVVGRVVAVRDARGWLDLRRVGARVYGRALAAHGLFWAALGSAAGLADRRVLRGWAGGPLRRAIVTLDRGLLRLGHALFFRLVHARRAPPAAFDAEPAAAILPD